MIKLKNIIQKKEYQNKIIEYFSDIGFELINNEKQIEQFKKEFKEFDLDLKDPEHYKIYQVLINTYWFCKAEDYEYFGIYLNPLINEYACVIKLDSEWEFRYMGNDAYLWINKYFRRKKNFNIPEKVIAFKNDTELMNNSISTFKEIESEDILSFYGKFN
jgi:hypothetical protein